MSEEKDLKPQTFEDWVERSPDIMALMYLKDKIEKLEKTQITKIFYEQWVDKLTALNKGIEELKDKIAVINVLANAKAVIVPEGKGIFWTNKIEELKLNQTDGTPNQNFIAIRILKDGMNTIGIKIENRFNKIESVLKADYLERKRWCELYKLYPNPAERIEFYNEQLKQLDGEKELVYKENPQNHYYKEGKRILEEHMKGSKPSRCKECGGPLVMDIATLNKGDSFCPKCFPKKEKPSSEPFYEIKYPKPKWIPQDIDDYFRNIPNDLPRIKYERLIEESNKQLAEFLKDWDFECPLEKKVSIRKENHAWTLEAYKHIMREKWQKKSEENNV